MTRYSASVWIPRGFKRVYKKENPINLSLSEMTVEFQRTGRSNPTVNEFLMGKRVLLEYEMKEVYVEGEGKGYSKNGLHGILHRLRDLPEGVFFNVGKRKLNLLGLELLAYKSNKHS
jgi:hypothetical protein